MWTNFLRHGSLVLTCLILSGCTRTEWAHRGDWIYQNNSAHTLEVKGARGDMSTGKLENFILLPGTNHCFEFGLSGESQDDPLATICPFDARIIIPDRVFQITVDGIRTVALEDSTGVRNRDNYQVEKLGERHFRFTYTFTDEVVRELLETQSP